MEIVSLNQAKPDKFLSQIKYVANALKNKKIIEAVWPGQITLILWKRRFIPLELTSGNETVAMRFNNHWFLDKLFEFIDFPLISTSANISGKENLYNITDLIKTFEKEKIK